MIYSKLHLNFRTKESKAAEPKTDMIAEQFEKNWEMNRTTND